MTDVKNLSIPQGLQKRFTRLKHELDDRCVNKQSFISLVYLSLFSLIILSFCCDSIQQILVDNSFSRHRAHTAIVQVVSFTRHRTLGDQPFFLPCFFIGALLRNKQATYIATDRSKESEERKKIQKLQKETVEAIVAKHAIDTSVMNMQFIIFIKTK